MVSLLDHRALLCVPLILLKIKKSANSSSQAPPLFPHRDHVTRTTIIIHEYPGQGLEALPGNGLSAVKITADWKAKRIGARCSLSAFVSRGIQSHHVHRLADQFHLSGHWCSVFRQSDHTSDAVSVAFSTMVFRIL